MQTPRSNLRMTLTLGCALLVIAGCATGPYSHPYSIVQAEDIRQADPNVIPLIVNRVDGVTSVDPVFMAVAPGHHNVTVDVRARHGFRATQVTFPIDMAPCTRYYVAARLVTHVTQEWTPVVTSTEPIGECRQKFAMSGAR